jgi:2-phospho-L-lactate guanylyltransferase (CobY/MobA/RfbA family)
MHIKIARKIGADIRIFLSRRIMIDIDTIEDIENLLKESSRSRAIAYIKSALHFDSAAFNRYSLYKD